MEKLDEQLAEVIDKIKLIPPELRRYLNTRLMDDDFDELDKQRVIIVRRINYSLAVLTMFDRSDIEIAEDLLRYSEQAKDLMLKKDRDGFKTFKKRWKRMIENIIEESKLNSYVVHRGGKIVKTKISSIYLYTQFEDVGRLDAFMEEYRSGVMAREIQGLVITKVSRVVISEKNYQRYRRYLAVATGEFLEGLKCVSFKEGESVELSCETRHFDTEVKWLMNEQEIVTGGNFSIKRVGFTRRLHITSPGPMDGSITVATTNESCTISLKDISIMRSPLPDESQTMPHTRQTAANTSPPGAEQTMSSSPDGSQSTSHDTQRSARDTLSEGDTRPLSTGPIQSTSYDTQRSSRVSPPGEGDTRVLSSDSIQSTSHQHTGSLSSDESQYVLKNPQEAAGASLTRGPSDSRHPSSDSIPPVIGKLTTMIGHISGDLHTGILRDLADEQEHLTELYEDATSCIPVLLENDEGLPLNEIYAPLLLEEDLNAMKRLRRYYKPSGSKTLDSVWDVFYVGGKLSTRIIIKGEAGSGKSVFCLKLVESWRQLKQSQKHEHVCEKHSQLIRQLEKDGELPRLLNQLRPDPWSPLLEIPCTRCEMQQCLSQFDLLYYVPLRDATEGKTSVVDMVCDAVCNNCQEEIDRTKRLLSNKNVRCLIVLDGVDEWPNPPGFTGLPTTRGLSMKCVLLWTMRPWKLAHLQLKPKHDDHMVTVSGLALYSVAKVIEKILVKFYGLSGEALKSKFLAYCDKVTDKTLEGIMRMPMMLIAACHLWHREDVSSLNKSLDTKQSFSVTHLYLEILDQMIQNGVRRQNKEGISKLIQIPQTSVLSDKEINPSTYPNLPIILRKFQHVCHFIDMLLPFCELAFTDLMSAETKLVFHKGQLEGQLGKSHVDLAHRLGLISQAKVRYKYPQPNVSVSFYHKSVQELLAAMYMTCGPQDAVTSFCQYCSTLEKAMETANITKFVVGLDPELGCRICEHITNIVNSDRHITEYSWTLDLIGEDRVRQLYLTQCEWHRELTHVRTVTGDTSPPPSLHVTDIYLEDWSDSDTVRVTGDLMYSNKDTIVSVMLGHVKHPLHSILHSLPQLTQLDTVRYDGSYYSTDVQDVGVVAAILQLTQLRDIRLYHVSLGDDGMVLTADWTRLQSVELQRVSMSEKNWEKFIDSLLTIRHPVDVKILDTYTGSYTRMRIRKSDHFSVTGDSGGPRSLEFTTVPPH